ncbi:MAG: hypothetical protein CMM54_11420, partial [Rhodospirillaceae bacterium]|nr:hypothetical protein [Rhodospirillaceae bacterium]
IKNAINASAADVTATSSGAVVTITANKAGTALGTTTITGTSGGGSATPAASVANVTANVDGDALTAENLRSSINAISGVTATRSGNIISITADTAGTPITGTTSVTRSDTTNSTATVETSVSNKFDVRIDSVTGAQNAIVQLKVAIDEMTNDRAKLGAIQQRLIFTDEQLRVAREKVTASKSRLIDVDVAEEATNYARYQILVQSGTQMLRQANELPKYALDLLR